MGSAVGEKGERHSRRATFVFPSSGRLGNQLFQYSAMRGFMTDQQRLVLLDFDDLAATFTGIDAELRSSEIARDRVRLGVLHRARHLRGSPLGRVVQDPATHLPMWAAHGSVATVRGYFQRDSPDHGAHVEPLQFRAALVAEAEDFLRRELRDGPDGPIAFVHVRRGDYLTHSVGRRLGKDGREVLGWVQEGASVALPAAWYRRRMAEIRDGAPGVRFVLVGDDPAWASAQLASADAVVSSLSPGADLVLMSRSDAGVLSASSFAWWGAWLASRRGSGNFLAPRHWLGHPVGEWWPEHVESGFLTYRALAD
jgi:hypothetical protein